MQDDPILAEMRRLRLEYAASLNNDPEAIYNDILRRQQQSDRKLVRFPPSKPRIVRPAVKQGSEPAVMEMSAN